MTRWLVAVALVLAGCAHGSEETGDERADQGRQNLAAIAALQGARLGTAAPSEALPEALRPGPAAEPDSMLITPGIVESVPRVAPPDVQVRVPWRPSPLAAPLPENWRVTPPYTVLSPVPPAYPGPRCVPDYFGGQRC